jgi:hypothetical protein
MSIAVPRWRFIEAMIQDAPEWKGVYVLWSHGAPLAVGHAKGADDTIRSRLLAHYAHAATFGMAEVTHYSWEICRDPVKREGDLVEQLGLRRRPAPAVPPPAPAKTEWSAHESS